MTREERKERRLARAKRTILGRFLCRLFGDEKGQGMMEYVVVGVMVVAAAVAIVLLFGQQIRASWDKMIKALKGEATNAAAVQNVSQESGARATGATISGADAQQ